MMEKTISNFCTIFYIPDIQKLAVHIPHVQLIGMNHCGESYQIAFKRRESFQDVPCCPDYAEKVVSRFSHWIQSEYYGVNRYVSIEGIVLEYFSTLP